MNRFSHAKRAFLVLAALLLTAVFTVGVFATAADAPADPPILIAPNPNAGETGAADTDAEPFADDTAAEDAAEVTDAAEAGINITLDRLPGNLWRMVEGMLCIIIVMGVLIGVTMLLNKITAPKNK